MGDIMNNNKTAGILIVLTAAALFGAIKYVNTENYEAKQTKFNSATPTQQFASVANGVVFLRCTDAATGQIYIPKTPDISTYIAQRKEGCTAVIN
jgi:hypothetical protein